MGKIYIGDFWGKHPSNLAGGKPSPCSLKGVFTTNTVGKENKPPKFCVSNAALALQRTTEGVPQVDRIMKIITPSAFEGVPTKEGGAQPTTRGFWFEPALLGLVRGEMQSGIDTEGWLTERENGRKRSSETSTEGRSCVKLQEVCVLLHFSFRVVLTSLIAREKEEE